MSQWLSAVFGGAFFVLLPLLLLLSVLVLFAMRQDSDEFGRRAPALYLSMVNFVALITLLFAAWSVISSLVEIPTNEDDAFEEFSDPEFGDEFSDDSFSFDEGEEDDLFDSDEPPSADDRAVDNAVRSFIVGLIAFGILFFHAGRTKLLQGQDGYEGSAASRTTQAYNYVTTFTTLLISAVATIGAIYSLWSIAAKDITGLESRKQGVVDFIDALVLAIFAGILFVMHLRRSPELRGLGITRGGSDVPPPAFGAPVASEPASFTPPSDPGAPPPPPPPPPTGW